MEAQPPDLPLSSGAVTVLQTQKNPALLWKAPSCLTLPSANIFLWLLSPETFTRKQGRAKRDTLLTTAEATSSSNRGLTRLLININPPNQSHAQKILDEETQGGRGVSNFLFTSSGKLRAPLI